MRTELEIPTETLVCQRTHATGRRSFEGAFAPNCIFDLSIWRLDDSRRYQIRFGQEGGAPKLRQYKTRRAFMLALRRMFGSVRKWETLRCWQNPDPEESNFAHEGPILAWVRREESPRVAYERELQARREWRARYRAERAERAAIAKRTTVTIEEALVRVWPSDLASQFLGWMIGKAKRNEGASEIGAFISTLTPQEARRLLASSLQEALP